MSKEAGPDGDGPKRERLEPGGAGMSAFERGLLMNPPQRPNIGAVPRSSVLGRLQDFLPKMQAANEQLERRLQSGAARAADVDIEAVDARAGGPVIKMDLACGLFDVKDARALEAAERALEAGPLAQPGSDGEDDSSDDDDSSSSGGDDDGEGPSGGAAAGQEDEEMADGGGGVAAGGAGRGGASGQRQQRRRLKGKAKRPLIQEVGAQEQQQQQQQQPTSRQ